MNKKEQLKGLIKRLHSGEDENEIKREFKQNFGNVTSSEISNLEQELIKDGMPVAEIQKLCNVHAAVFTGGIEDIHTLDKIDSEPGHPLFVFRKENHGITDFLNDVLKPRLNDYNDNPTEDNKVDLMAHIRALSKIENHYSRKENLFFPYLEKAGITGLPQVMWGKDDEVREMLKSIERGDYAKDDLVSKVNDLIEDVESMVVKENEILSPLLLKNIKAQEWIVIAEESPNIGYAFNGGIEGASPSDAAHWIELNLGKVSDEECIEEDTLQEGYIKFPSGLIKYEDMLHMMNTSPQDFTFIDKDDNVAYFSEGKHPVFPRTRTIIGRDVRNCHPPKVIHIVNQLIADFKAGIKDEEVRIVPIGTKILLVRYYAVRNEQNEYIGTLETTEEISSIVEEVNNLRNK